MANLKFLRYKTTSEFNTAKTNKTFKQGDVVFDSEAKILYIVTDNTPTLEPYYGNNAIKDVSCNNSEITATLSDGSTKKITVNNVVNAANASKTQATLTFGSQTFDGSSAKTITAADLGLSSALKFLGTTTTVLTDGATTNPITINGANVTAQIGNVVLYNHLEFLWNGSSWEELGDENSFALKSIQIKVGDGLSGGGALDGDVTISHKDTSSQASITTGGRTYINSITLDDYGHVTGLGTGTESNQTDISGNAATATSATTSKAITINTDAYSNTADSCMPTGADTFAVYRIGANSGATGADGNIIAMTWASSGYYGSQIYVDCDPTGYMAFRQRSSSGTWTVWRNIIHSGNIASQSVTYATSAGTATSCSGSAASLATSRTLWGQSFNGSSNVDGTIRITPTTNNWTEGIRIKPYSGNGWTTILLGGTDLSADTGTSTNSWSLHTYAGNFFINRNNSSATTPYLLCNVSGNWGMGTNAPAYKLDVQGTLRATGATTFSSSLSVTGDIAASSNVNVTNQTKSKTFNIDGGCTLEYDSTNKCVKFVF